MYDKIKLGLTRNRLFEFCNCVCFVGSIKESFDEVELKKALKMLSLKYPYMVISLCTICVPDFF